MELFYYENLEGDVLARELRYLKSLVKRPPPSPKPMEINEVV